MTLHRVSLAVLALGVTACGQQPASADANPLSGGPSQQEQKKATKNAGYDALMEMLDSKYIKCGDIYSTKHVNLNYYGEVGSIDWLQLSGLDPQVAEEELSNADRLNGLTFIGSVNLGDDMAKRVTFRDGWNPWENVPVYDADGVMTHRIMQQNGVWALYGWTDLMSDRKVRPSSCDEIPPDVGKKPV